MVVRRRADLRISPAADRLSGRFLRWGAHQPRVNRRGPGIHPLRRRASRARPRVRNLHKLMPCKRLARCVTRAHHRVRDLERFVRTDALRRRISGELQLSSRRAVVGARAGVRSATGITAPAKTCRVCFVAMTSDGELCFVWATSGDFNQDVR